MAPFTVSLSMTVGRMEFSMTVLENVVVDMEFLLYVWILGFVSHVDG